MAEMLKPGDMDTLEGLRQLPDFVIESVNQCIQESWDGTQARFTQDALASIMAEKSGLSVRALYGNKYLGFEPQYRALGWRVIYDKPGYCESYDAYFVVSRERARGLDGLDR